MALTKHKKGHGRCNLCPWPCVVTSGDHRQSVAKIKIKPNKVTCHYCIAHDFLV